MSQSEKSPDTASLEEVDLFQLFLRWKENLQASIQSYWEEISISRKGLLIIPLVTMIISSAACWAIFNIQNLPLTNINYYNLFKLLMLAISELFIWNFLWAFEKLNHFIVSWNLIKSSAKLDDVMQVSQSNFKMGHVVWVLMAFRIVSIFSIITADWVYLETVIGHYGCGILDYSQLINYTVNTQKLSTDLNYALCYGMGLPLKDGFLAGYTSFPLVYPTANFSFQLNPAPLAAIRSDCAYDLTPYMGTAPFPLGTGYNITASTIYTRSFHVNVNIFMPAAGFDAPTAAKNNFNSSWVVQKCNIAVQLGVGQWEFQFESDEWGVPEGGEAVSLNVPGFPEIRRGNTLQYSIDPYIAYLASSAENQYNYDFSNSSTDGSLLLTSLYQGVLTTFSNNTFYAPSQGVVSANLAGWGTAPNGDYYPELTYRGLSFGTATIFHQVLQQNLYSGTKNCTYNGYSGSGAIQMNTIGVIFINIIVAALLIFYLGYLFYHGYILKIRKKEQMSFRFASYCVNSELLLLTNINTWLNSCNKKQKHNALELDLDRFHNVELKFGRPAGKDININIGGIWIGPKKSTLPLRAIQETPIVKVDENVPEKFEKLKIIDMPQVYNPNNKLMNRRKSSIARDGEMNTEKRNSIVNRNNRTSIIQETREMSPEISEIPVINEETSDNDMSDDGSITFEGTAFQKIAKELEYMSKSIMEVMADDEHSKINPARRRSSAISVSNPVVNVFGMLNDVEYAAPRRKSSGFGEMTLPPVNLSAFSGTAADNDDDDDDYKPPQTPVRRRSSVGRILMERSNGSNNHIEPDVTDSGNDSIGAAPQGQRRSSFTGQFLGIGGGRRRSRSK